LHAISVWLLYPAQHLYSAAVDETRAQMLELQADNARLRAELAALQTLHDKRCQAAARLVHQLEGTLAKQCEAAAATAALRMKDTVSLQHQNARLAGEVARLAAQVEALAPSQRRLLRLGTHGRPSDAPSPWDAALPLQAWAEGTKEAFVGNQPQTGDGGKWAGGHWPHTTGIDAEEAHGHQTPDTKVCNGMPSVTNLPGHAAAGAWDGRYQESVERAETTGARGGVVTKRRVV